MSAASGQLVGGFRVVAAIRGGKGNQGAVVKAVCESATMPGVAVGEVVALKTMSLRDEDGSAYASFAKRTEMLKSLSHPNIVRYRGCFAENGPFSSLHVLVMDYLEGETLKEKLTENPGGIDADEAVRIMEGVLSGLDAASKEGIVHRDIKPGNIFICRDGTVKLIDFEIARKAGGTVSTASGRFAGTFDYMAPEFADPSFRGDARSDVFSAGVVFHEALTGAVPYTRAKEKGEQADFAFLSRWSQRQEGLCAIRIRGNIKRVLSHADEVIRRALSENPEGRYQSAAEFLQGMKAIRFRDLRSPLHSYRLLKVVGRGGFGEVFKARIRGTRDFVAVKHLLKSAYGARFRREARVMKMLDDSAFVKFVDYFETVHAGGEEAFLVMSYLPGMPGMSLRDAIRARDATPMPIKDVFRAFACYAHALSTMHKREIYHRDIKPANLYYPTGRPEAAAIMDLGIARDVNGTATSGQVPGTLDYMPPEIVLGNSRGDAGMDIYALGLCLYEAVSGKTAYPRLPTGPTAFAAFYERVRTNRAPDFDDPNVEAFPKLRSLLEDMTALDPAMRMQNADAVFIRLRELCEETGGLSPRPAASPRQVPAQRPAVPKPAPVRLHAADRVSGTVATSPTGVRNARHVHVEDLPRKPMGRAARWGLIALAVAGVLAVGAFFAKDPFCAWMERYKQTSAERRQQKIAEELRLRREAEADAERRRAEGVRRDAVAEADEVVKRYDGYVDSALAAGNAASEWILKWRGNADVKPVFASQTNRFSAAARERRKRDKKDSDKANAIKAEREANEIIAAFGGWDVSTKDCTLRASAWNSTWKPLLSAAGYSRLSNQIAEAIVSRRNRDAEAKEREDDERRRKEAMSAAERTAIDQAARIEGKYSDMDTSAAVAKAEYAVWQNEWGKYESEAFFRECRERIEKAAAARSLAESGRAVTAECERWLANIRSVSADDVRNWRTNLERAALELKRAAAERRISEADAEIVRSRIESCSRWSVGVVDNKTYRTIDFAGTKISPVSAATIVFTNGVPDGVAVTSDGCEPLRVREADFDSGVVVVLPKNLRERTGGAMVRVREFQEGLLCLIDGVERHPGVVDIRPGRHHVVWRSTKETYPGVRDYKDQDILFEAKRECVMDVPIPSPTWSPSPEFEFARQNAKHVERGRAIVENVRSLLAPEPLETRRARLEKAHGVLTNWQTASALAVLGERVELDLRSEYEAEKQRVRGYVRNSTDVPASIKTDVAQVVVQPGAREMITFERKWSGQAYARLPHYEFVFLPRVRDEFDGKEFVIEQSRLVPLPVKVTVPSLDEGVKCMLAGKEASGAMMVRPGTYECAYSRPDCKTQKFDVEVQIGKDRTLPPPSAWEESGALSAFGEALSSFASGAVEKAKDLTSSIGTIEDPEKRRELDELKRAIELREKLDHGN